MTREEVEKLYEIYGRAWETKDAELIVTAFNDEATYDEPREPENIGKEAIKSYWESKVVNGQDKIKFELKNIWIDGETGIAEYHVTFVDLYRNIFIDMVEIGIFTIKNGKFDSLREFYKTTKTAL